MTPALCRAVRAYAGLTMHEFAERAGVTYTTVWSFENRIYTPRGGTVEKIRTAALPILDDLKTAASE